MRGRREEGGGGGGVRALVSCDSEVPWVYRVKDAWPTKPLKYVAAINRRALPETTDPSMVIRYIDISSVSSLGEITNIESMSFEAAPSRARRVVQHGDTIVSTVRTYLKAVAPIPADDEDLIASTGFAVVTPDRSTLDPTFLSYWLRGSDFVDEVCARSIGVSYPATNSSEVGGIPLPLPPLPTQRAIADFLDRKTAALDGLIARKERLLELLAERREALIHRAVTRGLDPDVPLKDSGVPWIGEVPAHWEVTKTSHRCTVFNGATPSRHRSEYWTDGTIPWLASGQVNDYVVVEPNEWITAEARADTSLRMAPVGSVVVGMIGQGRTRGMSSRLGISACINQNMAAIVPGSQMDSTFLHFYFISAYAPLREEGRGANQGALNCEILRDFALVVPPIEEQKGIGRHLSQREFEFQRHSETTDKQLTLLREYRQALITAAVTGQLAIPEVSP